MKMNLEALKALEVKLAEYSKVNGPIAGTHVQTVIRLAAVAVREHAVVHVVVLATVANTDL